MFRRARRVVQQRYPVAEKQGEKVLKRRKGRGANPKRSKSAAVVKGRRRPPTVPVMPLTTMP